jgi:hypothetical protein
MRSIWGNGCIRSLFLFLVNAKVRLCRQVAERTKEKIRRGRPLVVVSGDYKP